MRYAIRWFKCKLKPPNNSHINIYEDIEDLYIDNSFPGNLDNISKNPNFPEPFYYCLEAESEQCSCKGACAC